MATPTILLVEDTVDFAELVVTTLRVLNVRVVPVRNGADAWAYLSNQSHPAAIILDLNMPVIDGWKFRELQFGNTDLWAIPTIILSDESDLSMIARTLNVSGFVKKSDVVKQLVPTLQKVFERGCTDRGIAFLGGEQAQGSARSD